MTVNLDVAVATYNSQAHTLPLVVAARRMEMLFRTLVRRIARSRAILAPIGGACALSTTAVHSLAPPAPPQRPPLDLAVSHASYAANEPIEDRWTVHKAGDKVIACVLDGHGGWQAAEFAQHALPETIVKEFAHNLDNDDAQQVAAAMIRAFERVDRDFISRIAPAFQVRKDGFCRLTLLQSVADTATFEAC